MTVESTVKIPFHYTTDTTMGDIMSRPEAWKLVQSVLSKGMFGQVSEVNEGGDAAKEAISDEMNAAMLQYMPLRGPVSFGGGVSMADVQKLVDRRTFHDRSYGDVRRIVRRAAAGEFSAGGGTDRCGAQKAGKALPDSCECEKTVPGGDTAAGKGA